MLFALTLCLPVCAGAEVIKSVVDGQGFVADFYFDAGLTNKFGVLFLGGSEGGKPDGRLARILAERGYPTLGVAYFNEKGLPETLQSIPLEYFDKPIAWLGRQQVTFSNGIVVV